MNSPYCLSGTNELSKADIKFLSKLHICCVFLYTEHHQVGYNHIATCANRYRNKEINRGKNFSLEAAFLRLLWPPDLKSSMKSYDYQYIPF